MVTTRAVVLGTSATIFFAMLVIHVNRKKRAKSLVVYIEGNIATGKSTLLDGLQIAMPNCQTIKEPIGKWREIRSGDGRNLLDNFYSSPHETAYLFQSFAFFSRAKVLKDIDYSCPIVFIERSVHSDKLFAQNCHETGLMSTLQWNLYLEWFEWITTELIPLPAPTIHIYLRCTPAVSHERLCCRGRKEENAVGLNYLEQIHAQHEKYFATGKRADVVILDATNVTSDQMVATVIDRIT